MIAEKKIMHGFSLRDDADRSLPLLNRQQNGEAAFSILSNAFQQVALRESLTPEIQEILFAVAAKDTVDLDMALSKCRKCYEYPGDRINGVRNFEWLLKNLDTHFIMLADYSCDDLLSRQVAKIQYETERSDDMSLWQRIGTQPTNISFTEPDIQFYESLHYEFRAPKGLDIVDVVVFADEKVLDPQPRSLVESSMTSVVFNPKDYDQDLGEVEMEFRICPSRDGLLNAIFATCFVAASILTCALIGAGEFRMTTNGDLALLLLLVPGLVGAVITRPGEHSFVSRRLRMVRIAAGLSCLSLYAAAAFFALPWSLSGLRHSILLLMMLAWFLVFFVVLVYVRIGLIADNEEKRRKSKDLLGLPSRSK
jgi:hypothetical protein